MCPPDIEFQDYYEPLRQVGEAVTSYFVHQCMMQALSDVSVLHRDETWRPHSQSAVGVTQLPAKFKGIVQKALKEVGAIPTTKPEVLSTLRCTYISTCHDLLSFLSTNAQPCLSEFRLIYS
jgi:hypothetical protein